MVTGCDRGRPPDLDCVFHNKVPNIRTTRLIQNSSQRIRTRKTELRQARHHRATRDGSGCFHVHHDAVVLLSACERRQSATGPSLHRKPQKKRKQLPSRADEQRMKPSPFSSDANMDDEHTAGFREPCSLCSAVDWGISDEGRFYCKSCHNVIERTREVVDPTVIPGSSRISSISRGRRRRRESLRQWMICEAFQFILRNQANALLRLGVSAHFKDQVLCPLWRRYLQSSRQAYTSRPVRSATFKVHRPDLASDSVAETSASETDVSSIGGSVADSGSDWSRCSGSLDGASYLTAPLRKTRLMSMTKTLALVHVALVWSREPLTLSDLLRLVSEGLVPYTNAYEELPEEMKLEGQDVVIFKVESVPAHQALHREAQTLVQQLQLQAFPPISRQSLLHPALLSLRYLTDANLPDELHPWLCRLMDCAGLVDETLHTFDPVSCPELPLYDVQAAALIVITMKLIFGMDDHTEWDLSNEAGVLDDAENVFHLRRWFRLTQAALTRAQQTRRRHIARKQWKVKKPLCRSRKVKSVVMKGKRTAEQVQMCFEKLSCRPAGVQHCDVSSFRFCWGDKDGADGPSLHHQRLDGALTLKHNVLTPSNSTYWHPVLRRCDPQKCGSHYSEVEATLPRSFVWLLQLFCFLLDVEPAHLYEEVLKLERRVLTGRTARSKRPRRTERTRESTTKTGTRSDTRKPQGRQETRGTR
ncbi:TATA box-binding protein-associated factor RNA polymerase I subunit B isoform X2 [Scophthalmus maximus]|uniref:TATA box-binding protein-associated factor RNA polymerase I subunit B isoform X2 n=1 Tax=Scophthalmus maximus TaxID=52904 RepID=UPI001FA883FB|nr:TATA box-binding protein-associated factor RNA polymerase I subunit B isoform X2 [Scophthalmus maximus]